MTPLLVSLTVTLPTILTAIGGLIVVIRRQGVCPHAPPHDHAPTDGPASS